MLSELPPEQEIFNEVATHLLKQGKASRVNFGVCLYRGPDNTSCAVGCLIPDEMYDQKMEGRGASLLVMDAQAGDFNLPNWFKYNLPLLGMLQRIHDEAEPEDWRKKLLQLATFLNLTTEALDAHNS